MYANILYYTGCTEPGEVDADSRPEVVLHLIERLLLEQAVRVGPEQLELPQLGLVVQAEHREQLVVDQRLHHQVPAVQRGHQLLAVREFAAAKFTTQNEPIYCTVLSLFNPKERGEKGVEDLYAKCSIRISIHDRYLAHEQSISTVKYDMYISYPYE